MSEILQIQRPDFIALTSEIVSAYVSKNSVRSSDLPTLIASIHASLQGIEDGKNAGSAGTSAEEFEQPTAVQIRKSVMHDGLISFIDGKTYKILKRHLTQHGLGPISYRARYGLPSDYPMVAPSYSETRSRLAKGSGLGRPNRSAA